MLKPGSVNICKRLLYNYFSILYFQVGCAVGFLLPPVLVPYSEDLNQIGKDMGTMFYMGAGVTTFFFIMVILSKSSLQA